jgi:two-component system CheB/CheR fusion protein
MLTQQAVFDALRTLREPMHELGESLGVNRVIYAVLRRDREEVVVETGYVNGLAPVSGAVPTAGFAASFTRNRRLEEPLVEPDVANSPSYDEQQKANYRALDIAAHVDVPVVNGGEPEIILSVQQATPRQWTEQDVALVRMTAQQMHEAVDRVGVETRLQESEERLRLLIQTVQDHAIFMLDPNGNVASWNEGAERILGYRENEILGQTAARLFTLEDQRVGKPARELSTAESAGRANDENWLVRKNGERFWASGATSALRNEAGELRGFVKILRDLTRQKNAEQRLQESEERLRVALSAGRMGTWLWRIRTDEQLIDSGLRELMGLRHDGKPRNFEEFVQAIHPDDRQQVRAEFDRALREGGDMHVEFRVWWPDGSEHWLVDQGQVFLGADKRADFMAGACMDITNRKCLEQALEEADRRKDEFLAMLAHELRNPLAPIQQSSELLALDDLDRETLDLARSTIQKQTEYLVRLVDDLLDASRLMRGRVSLHKARLDLAIVVRRAIEEISPYIRQQSHQLDVSLPGEPLYLEADEVRLVQIVANLLHNAAKFTKPGGHIQVSAEPENGFVVIRVRDDGQGISADVLPHVFDLFLQADPSLARSAGGLGIGLAVVRSLVELHNGRIEAHSAGPGQGSEFVVRLPLTPQPNEQEARPWKPARGVRRRVLVVDDNVPAAKSLAAMLSKAWGHEVQIAHDGEAALELARRFLPDIVLLDIGLPEIDGYEVARRLRSEPETAAALIVAVSGYGQEEDRRRSREAGFDDHFLKPLTASALEPLFVHPKLTVEPVHA